MSISNGEAANEINFNNAFHSRTAAQVVINKTIDGTNATGTNTITNDASDVTYDTTSSGLTGTNAQAAIDEVEARVDTAETNIINNDTDISSIQTDILERFDTVTGHDHDGVDAKKVTAANVLYVNASSGLTANEVNAAIDEVEGRVDVNETDIGSIETDITNRFNTTTGHEHDGADSAKVIAENLNSSGGLYIGTQTVGVWDDGAWRLSIVGGTLAFQKKITGTWVTQSDMGV